MITEAMRKLMDYFRPKTTVAKPVEQVKPARPRKEERRAIAKPAAKKERARQVPSIKPSPERED